MFFSACRLTSGGYAKPVRVWVSGANRIPACYMTEPKARQGNRRFPQSCPHFNHIVILFHVWYPLSFVYSFFDFFIMLLDIPFINIFSTITTFTFPVFSKARSIIILPFIATFTTSRTDRSSMTQKPMSCSVTIVFISTLF